MKPKAHLNSEKEDPLTELGLSLGYSTVCSRTAVRNDPSAGANAGSLSFVAANPISELVWSPQGLTLKYVDCSFVDRQTSRFLGVGPSNMVISTSQAEKVDHANIESTKGDIMTSEGKDRTNEAYANKVAPDVGDSTNKEMNSNFDLLDQAETASKPGEKTLVPFTGRNVERINELLQNVPDPGDCDGHEKASGCSSKKQVMVVPLDAFISPMHKDNPIDEGIRSHLVENDQVGNPSIPLSEKRESMNENDVREPDNHISGEADMKCAASESSSEVKSESMHGTQNHLEKLIPPCNHSPENGRVLENHSADKGRASFDTDADGRLLKGKSDSRESVESCNRTMVAKRWCVDQPMFIGSKRPKQIDNEPSFSGFSAQNSSFVNWISNMMKGLSRPTTDAGAPLSFAFADPSTSPDNVTCTHMSEQNVRYTGFKSFKKIYQPNQHVQEMGFPDNANDARIGSSSAGGMDEVCTICADPTQRHKGTDDVRKQLLLSNEEFNEDASVVGSGPSSLPLGIHGHVSVYKGESLAYKGEQKVVLVNKDALIMSTSSPLDKKTSKADSTEEKTPQFGCRGDSGALWINRFSSKAHCSLLKLDEATQGPGGATESCPNSGRTLVQSTRSRGSEKNVINVVSNEYHNERLFGAAGNELPNCHVSAESSVGFTRAGSYREEDNVRKVDVMLPSKHLKSSEEMAPTFARRLDALRCNIPPKSNDDEKKNLPCFFCGMMCHQIRACTKAVSCPHKQVQDNERDGFGFWVRQGFAGAASVQNEQTLLRNCRAKGNRYSKQKVVSSSGTLIKAREYEDVSTATNQKDQTEITSGCDLVMDKISGVPKGIFDMIKMLRLSRTDILKWMNSGASLIHLDGYFLRLRLGKWGDGLGGSGYRVACISGMTQIQRLPVNGKIFVSVNVGGVKCMTGSQYISNQDFIEDELKAWWSTTSKGGKMPSEDELQYKVEERRRLCI